MTSKCSKCSDTKPKDEFYKNKSRWNGVSSHCKLCQKSYLKEYGVDYRQRPEARAASNVRGKAYYKTEAGKEAQMRAVKLARERYPEKSKARSLVQNAVRYGRLAKQPCGVCGSLAVEAHHHDYNKPLEVQWLCKQHHDGTHKS